MVSRLQRLLKQKRKLLATRQLIARQVAYLDSFADVGHLVREEWAQGGGGLSLMRMGDAPDGRSRWTLRLLGQHMVELGHVESVSHETIRQTLKKRTETLAK